MCQRWRMRVSLLQNKVLFFLRDLRLYVELQVIISVDISRLRQLQGKRSRLKILEAQIYIVRCPELPTTMLLTKRTH